MSNPTEYNGKILIALPNAQSPFFHKSVIYVHSDDETGGVGIMLNHRMDAERAASWSADINWHYPDRVYHGGEHDVGMGYILHTADYSREVTVPLNKSLNYTGNKHIVNDINDGIGPLDFTLIVGYCTWQAGEIHREVIAQSWHVADFDESYFFTNLDKTDGWDYSVDVAAITQTEKLLKEIDIS